MQISNILTDRLFQLRLFDVNNLQILYKIYLIPHKLSSHYHNTNDMHVRQGPAVFNLTNDKSGFISIAYQKQNAKYVKQNKEL